MLRPSWARRATAAVCSAESPDAWPPPCRAGGPPRAIGAARSLTASSCRPEQHLRFKRDQKAPDTHTTDQTQKNTNTHTCQPRKYEATSGIPDRVEPQAVPAGTGCKIQRRHRPSATLQPGINIKYIHGSRLQGPPNPTLAHRKLSIQYGHTYIVYSMDSRI